MACELFFFAAAFAVTQTIAAIGFPIILLAPIPFRVWVMPRWFRKEELDVLDAPTASPFTMESVGGVYGAEEAPLGAEAGRGAGGGGAAGGFGSGGAGAADDAAADEEKAVSAEASGAVRNQESHPRIRGEKKANTESSSSLGQGRATTMSDDPSYDPWKL